MSEIPLNHKVVCWKDYAIPVPLWAKWMTFEWEGCGTGIDKMVVRFWGYEPHWHQPKWGPGTWRDDHYRFQLILPLPLFHDQLPEPGRSSTQKYWIGD